MKKMYAALFLIVLPSLLFAQSADCKFEKSKDARTGKPMKIIQVPTKLGKLIVTKAGDSVYVFYNMKLGFQLVADDNNMVSLSVDSVNFIFKDNYHYMLKPANGYGKVKNAVALKPQFQTMTFTIILDKKTAPYFFSHPIQFIQVFGEKDSEYNDALSDEKSQKFSNAVKCFYELNL